MVNCIYFLPILLFRSCGDEWWRKAAVITLWCCYVRHRQTLRHEAGCGTGVEATKGDREQRDEKWIKKKHTHTILSTKRGGRKRWRTRLIEKCNWNFSHNSNIFFFSYFVCVGKAYEKYSFMLFTCNCFKSKLKLCIRVSGWTATRERG